MLKLFKYNWKMNSMKFYVTFTATVLFYALLIIGKYRYGWLEEIIFIIGILIALLSILIFSIIIGVTCNHCFKSYHRRLIPIRPIEEISSMALLTIVYMVAATLIAVGYFKIADLQFFNQFPMETIPNLLEPESVLILLGVVIRNAIAFVTILMLAMSVTYCFRGKYRAWIGVLIFIGFPLGTDWLTSWMIGETASDAVAFIRLEIDAKDEIRGTLADYVDFWSLSTLMDVTLISIKVFVINYIMKKHTEL